MWIRVCLIKTVFNITILKNYFLENRSGDRRWDNVKMTTSASKLSGKAKQLKDAMGFFILTTQISFCVFLFYFKK